MRSPRTTEMSTPRRAHHLLAAGMAVGLATLAVAPAAMAANGYWSFTGRDSYGGDVTFTDGTSRAALLEIDLDGNKLDTYCIQRTVTTSPGDGKTEVSWAESGIDNLDKVAWILHNSVPGGEDLAGLSAQVTAHAELNGMTLETDGIDMAEAVQGTQAAIWHFTDKATLAGTNDDDLTAVYTYLSDTHMNGGMSEAHHSIEVTGPSGAIILDHTADLVGPFRIDTDLAKGVTVHSTGGTLVRADGTAVTTAQHGDELWVKVAQGTDSGQVQVIAEGTGSMILGRVFAPVDPENPTQTLITASTDRVTLTDTATVDWSRTPTVEPTPEVTPTPTPEVTPTPTPEVTPTPSPVVTPTPAPVVPVTPVVTPTPTPAPVVPATPVVTPTPAPVTPTEQAEGIVLAVEETVGANGAETSGQVVSAEENVGLARTGGSLAPALLGAGLLAGGAAMIIAKRRSQA